MPFTLKTVHWITGMAVAVWVTMGGVPVAEATSSKKPPEAAPKESQTAANSGKIWGKSCETDESTKKETCFVSQEQKMDDKLVLRIAVGRLGADKKVILLATLPLGIFIPAGVAVQLDPEKDDLFRLVLQYCTPGGCLAAGQLDDKELARLRKATVINVLARQTDNTKNIAFPVKMEGFDSEFKAIH